MKRLPVSNDIVMPIAKFPGEYEVEFQSAVGSKQLASGISAKGGYASGVYYYQLKVGENIQTKKMILIK